MNRREFLSTAAAGVVIKSNQALDIVTPIENIGAGTAMLIGRYGGAQQLITSGKCVPTQAGLEGATLEAAVGGERLLTVPLRLTASEVQIA